MKKKTDRKPPIHNLDDWHEEVSRTSVQTYGSDEFVFKLFSFGIGMPPEILSVSVKGISNRELEIGIDEKQIGHLATWLVECLYLLDSLESKKGEQILKAERRLAKIHRRKWFRKWSKKFARTLR